MDLLSGAVLPGTPREFYFSWFLIDLMYYLLEVKLLSDTPMEAWWT